MATEVPYTPGEIAEVQRLLRKLGLHDSERYAQQVLVFLEASRVYMDRDAAYGEQWKGSGAIDNLRNALRKIKRQLHVLTVITDGGTAVLSKDNLDDAIDAMNYVAFAIRNARLLNLDGDDGDS